MPDNRYTFDYQQPIEDTELYEYLCSISDINAKVIALLVQGYTHHEIALKMGRTGNAAALRNWTGRVVRKMKEDTLAFYSESDSLGEVSTYARMLG
jgi:hypothetical protein